MAWTKTTRKQYRRDGLRYASDTTAKELILLSRLAGCADAAPAVSADANNRPANAVIFMDASLLSWIFAVDLRCDVNAISPRGCGEASSS
jgi:hypothetical protein